MTWDELFQRFSAARRLSRATLQGYRKNLAIFLAFCPGEASEVQPSDLRAFYRDQKNRPRVSAATAGARLRTVLLLLRWAVRQELLLVDPGHDMKIPKPGRPIPRVLTQDEVERLMSAPDKAWLFIRLRDRALLELLYGTGMRGGEALALNVSDLDLADRSLRILSGKGKNRRIPFGESVVEAMQAYLDWLLPRYGDSGETALFVSEQGERMTSKNLSSQLNRYGKALNIPDVTPHGLRRAIATHMLENGANIAEIKTMLGHEDINSTQVYTRVFPAELIRTHRQSHPRARRQERNDES